MKKIYIFTMLFLAVSCLAASDMDEGIDGYPSWDGMLAEIESLETLDPEIVEVFELVPPRGDFHYVHATCKPVPPAETSQG